MLFTTDAFGRRITCRPRLMWDGDSADGGGGNNEPTKVVLDGEEFSFPEKTAVKDMTPEQAAEYWRHEAKKQQKKPPQAPADYAELQTKAKELEKLQREGLDENERKIAEARDEARREGENIGAERYLKDAVTARFQHLTGLTDDEVNTAFDVVDPKKFLGENGEILADKLQAFAATFGPKDGGDGGKPTDPVREHLERQRGGGSGGSGTGSVSQMRDVIVDQLTGGAKK